MVLNSLPGTLYTATQVRELDRIVIQEHKIPGIKLMQRAGAFAYRMLCEKWPNAKSITVICGGGNNAGDGYVLAELAQKDNKAVSVLTLIPPEKLKGDALAAFQSMQKSGLPVQNGVDANELNTDVIVDALLGTGLDREVEGQWYDTIQRINDQAVPVLSVDIPSGLNADSGHPMGIVVKADMTVTFIGVKRGLLTGQASDYVGELYFDDLDVPSTIYDELNQDAVSHITFDHYFSQLKPRARSAHKGHYGHVLIVGGDQGTMGAALMAASAAARTGAGLVSVATRQSHAAMITAARPELMSHGVETVKQLTPLLERATVIAIGPGLGQSDWGQGLLSKVLEMSKPIVLDADGLNLLAQEPLHKENWVLTPHPGEAARLSGTNIKTIQADRYAAVVVLQQRYGGVVVLKGSGTIIADSNGGLSLCSAGNPGMASGGMGDVLSGIIAGLIAQGHELNQATKMGVCLHATAADNAAQEGERGLLASDLMPWIRTLINPGG